MTAEQRSDISNGIWLCQTHAKLIDDDELTYTATVLHEWKVTAEQMAALEAKGYEVRKAHPFADLERKAPKLLEEMRQDLAKRPLCREFILMERGTIFNGSNTPLFRYYYEDHMDLAAVMTIMRHYGAIYDSSINRVPRFTFMETFVRYLIGDR